MRRLLFSIILFICVISLCIVNDIAIQKIIDPIISNVEIDEIDKAFSEWNSYESLLGVMLPHSELDETNRLFIYVKKAQELDEEAQYQIDHAALIQQLNRLPELGKPEIKNIF